MSVDKATVVKEIIRLHNEYRSKHGSPPLIQDPALEAEAQAYAEKLVQLNKLQHDSSKKHGENLFMMGSSRLPTAVEIAEKCINSFYSESQGYNYSQKRLGASGHFTQMIWRESKNIGVGIGVKDCTAQNGMYRIYISVKYDPAGNFLDEAQYNRNVHPPR